MPPAATLAARAPSPAAVAPRAARNPYRLYVTLFILSLLLPVSVNVGNLIMQPYRVLLLVLFVPLTVAMLTGRAGRLMVIDGLMLATMAWSALALVANHPLGQMVDTVGILLIEFMGAYMLARVGIRSADDMVWAAKLMFWIVLALLPFAVYESVTRQAILLKLLPGSHAVVDAGIRLNLRRAQSVFAHPIHYGVFVSAMLGLVWYVVCAKTGRVARLAASLAVFVAAFCSLSTAAVIAFMAQFYMIAYDRMFRSVRRQWRLFAILMIGGYVAIDAASNRTPFDVLVDYLSFNQGSAYHRILIWKHGMENVWANPLFGIGYYDWVRPAWLHSSSADNYWLLIAMRYGIPALLFMTAAIVIMIRRISWAPLTDPMDRACRAGFLVTLAGLIVSGGTVHYWNSMFSFVTFMMFCGMWLIDARAAPVAATESPAAPPRRRAVFGAADPAPPVPAQRGSA